MFSIVKYYRDAPAQSEFPDGVARSELSLLTKVGKRALAVPLGPRKEEFEHFLAESQHRLLTLCGAVGVILVKTVLLARS